MLGYIPFLDPLHVFQVWRYLLLIPLCFGISIIYKALRMPRLAKFWREVALMTTQIVLAMVGLAILLIAAVQVAIPLLPVR